MDTFIQKYILNIATSQGLLHQINLVTKREEISNLFENLTNAIGYKVKFCKYENSIITANKYNDPSEPHTVSFWHE